ncbi:hypothetical protein TRAPUB_5947 [Trametes pubescens]|uniref:Uncharacterized protein n=1 Tax=Trametes pubescens TaxID=154538 RepID=A0A1M2W700_TRAPU|nr:hypothetical protein TRAPUB_5947 [Trametes pubescens]
MELQVETVSDPDLCLLEVAARVLRLHFIKPRAPAEEADRFLDVGGRDALRRIRTMTYESATGVWGKLAWWHNHIWSSEETWLRTAAIWEIRFGKTVNFSSIADWDRWITHVASTAQSEPDEDDAMVIQYADYRLKALIPFAVSIPLAMVARWTGRRSLLRPMNGLQRLLLWASIYPSFMKPYQHYAYLRGFEKKHQYAQDIRNSVGLDSENNLI